MSIEPIISALLPVTTGPQIALNLRLFKVGHTGFNTSETGEAN